MGGTTPAEALNITGIAGDGGQQRLAQVHRIIADRSCSALSLDIFDTVLWRRVPRPADLFGIVGARLRTAGTCASWVTDATFRRMRIEAEKRARAARDAEALGTEVSLFDIWRAMPSGVFGDARLEELVEAEVKVEREFTVVDLDIAEVIELAGKQDLPVVLVSDTYFTEDQLAYLLNRPELALPGTAKVFRSHQHGLDKGSGLFQIVLGELGLSPEQVVHVGDNEYADIEVPAELGVRTVHYRRFDDAFEAVLDREHEPTQQFGPYAPNLDVEHGDFGLTSLRAKTLQTRDTESMSPADVAWRFGAGVMGPVLTGFAEWVTDWAARNGVRTLWCPMREGELLSELLNNAARARGHQLVAKPVWLSRHVTSIAALDSLDTESVHQFLRRSYHLAVRSLLAMLDLRAGDVPGLAGELDTIIDNGIIADKVSIALTETAHLRNRIMVTVTAARERLIAALDAAGALADPELVMVDLGWGATIQYQLSRALRVAEVDVTPTGLYLATDDRSTRVYVAGLRAEGYLAQAGHPADIAGPIVRSPEVIEQCVNAICGSLIGFQEDGQPILGPDTESHSQHAERRSAQRGILAFQANWHRYLARAEGAWPGLARPAAARARLANILVSALKMPTPDEAAVFGNWTHDDNFGSSVTTRVLPDDLRAVIPYLSPNDLPDLHMRDAFWPALIAASDPELAAAARAVADGSVDPVVFEPTGEPFECTLRFRTTDDRWHAAKPTRVRINHNGLSFARVFFERPYTLDLSITVPGRPAVVRIDWIEAKVIAGGRSPAQIVRFDQPTDFAAAGYTHGCRWLGGNMLEFESTEAAVAFPIAERAGGPVSSGQITIAFAMLPQSLSTLSPRMSAAGRLERLSMRITQEYRSRGAKGVAAGAARVALRKWGGSR